MTFHEALSSCHEIHQANRKFVASIGAKLLRPTAVKFNRKAASSNG